MNLSLFQRDVVCTTLGSGSRGNCTYIGDGFAGVLVDCGISAKQVFQRMAAVGLGEATIDAVLITHEHSDHVGAARILANKLAKRQGAPVPFFMTEGTRDGLPERCVPDGIETVTAGDAFRLRHLDLECFPVPHDTRDPIAWRVGIGGQWAGVITDLGRPTALIREKLRSLSIAVLEFNHDEQALFDGAYPWHLKQRIRSNHGHLSNAQAAELLSASLGESLQHLVLAHLSGENNSPEMARRAATDVLLGRGADHIMVSVAKQGEALQPLRVRADRW